MSIVDIKRDLKELSDPAKAAFFPRYFKTGPGEYGAGDKFIGVTVPNIRAVAKKHRGLPLSDIQALLKSPIHEHRYVALVILTLQYEKAEPAEQGRVARFYLKNLKYVNNWDLVDTSAPYILGPYYFTRSRQPLLTLAGSNNLWKQRVAILATYHFIKQNDFSTTLELATKLLHHEHDLIHKAVGWMLREVGNRNRAVEEAFLKKYYKTMPRTALRYAIEKFPAAKRQAYLKGEI